MKNTRIYTCDNTIDGIFTAIYDAFASHYGHEFIKIEENSNDTMELFSEYENVITDLIKSTKVANTIRNKISEDAYFMVCNAALSNDTTKANSIYHFVILGLSMGSMITTYLSNPFVNHVFKLSRNTSNETHSYLGFLRFREITNKILFAEFSPKNNILSLIAPHFVDRLPLENFIIHDVVRNIAAIHQTLSDTFIILSTDTTDFSPHLTLDSDEKNIQNLFKSFTETISIKERTNESLQNQKLPLRFRKYMTDQS